MKRRGRHDPEIGEPRPRPAEEFHVAGVVFQPLRPVQGVATVDLGKPRDARHGQQPGRLAGVVAGHVAHRQGTRANEAHVAGKHAEELREFVETRAAQKPAKRAKTGGVG